MARRNYTLDDSGLTIKASAAVGATAAGSVIADLGAGFVEGNILIDVTGIEIADNDETYDIILQLSPDAAFGTAGNIREKLGIHLGAKEIKRSDCDADDVIGRYIVPFNNDVAGTVYRYGRIYTGVGGTITTGITYGARLCKR